MARARQQHDWSQTAAVCSVFANCNRDPRRRARPYTPDDFNPFADRRSRRKAVPTPIDLAIALGVRVSEEDRQRAAEKYGVTIGR